MLGWGGGAFFSLYGTFLSMGEGVGLSEISPSRGLFFFFLLPKKIWRPFWATLPPLTKKISACVRMGVII